MMFGYFIGYLGADPEERMTSKGKRVVVLRLGVKVRNSSGKDETVWCKCNIWHNRFDKMITYLKKGSSVIVGGDFTVESYLSSRDNTPQSSLSISVDSLKFSPFSRSEPRPAVEEASAPSSYESVSVGFDGESLDAEAIADKDMYAGYGQSQEYVSEDVPF